MSRDIKIEKQVWESTLKASMDRAGRVEILEQQLAIAVEALEKIKEMTSPPCYTPYFEQQYIWASLALQQIKEVK